MSKVINLFISNEKREKKSFIDVDENGVIGDKFYAKNSSRTILITSISSYELSLKNGIKIDYGDLGENILIDLDIYHLKEGDRLQIGNCMFEITQNCTICKSLSKIDKKLPNLLKNDRGIFAKAISKSRINIGDKVVLF